jgi:hypothetical protein
MSKGRVVQNHIVQEPQSTFVVTVGGSSFRTAGDGWAPLAGALLRTKANEDVWGIDGVGLAATEFRKARELGDRYWLYVVEWATSDQPEMYRTRIPPPKANWFFFDRGWSQTAEPRGDISPEDGTPKGDEGLEA